MKLSIQKKLDEKGITRYELAKRIGVTYPTIDNIYKGKSTSIKLEILEAICRELDCTPNEIMVSDLSASHEEKFLNRILAYYHAFQKEEITQTQFAENVEKCLEESVIPKKDDSE